MQPENGGLGVFAHEYGHDLGLPDLYDTSGNTGGAENSTGFWTLMSSGANIGDGSPDGIGDAPTDLGAWERFQLGWLEPQGSSGPFYEVASAGAKSTHKLGPEHAGYQVTAGGRSRSCRTRWCTRTSAPGAEAGDYFWAIGADRTAPPR